jgi:hypothetical protein
MPGFFQYTEGRDFWVLADDEAIKPGYAEYRVAGAKFENGNLLLDVEFYENRQKDVTEGIPAVQFMEPSTRSAIYKSNSSLARGLEILLQKKMGRFVGWASYSFSKTQITTSLPGADPDFPANQDIPHKLNLVGSYTRNGWNLSTTWTYTSGAPFTRPNIERITSESYGELLQLSVPPDLNSGRLPNMHRLDVSLTRAFITKHFYGHIGISVYNLYDRHNTWYRNFVLDRGELKQEDVATLGFTPTISLDVRWRLSGITSLNWYSKHTCTFFFAYVIYNLI